MFNENLIRCIGLLVGCVYPAFESYKIFSTKSNADSGLRVWLIYWIVYGIFAALDFVMVALFWWVPFINEFKFIFLCWLLPTVGGGCEPIYKNYVEPIFARNEAAIDKCFIVGAQKFGDILSDLMHTMCDQFVVVAKQCWLTRQKEKKVKPIIMVSIRKPKVAYGKNEARKSAIQRQLVEPKDTELEQEEIVKPKDTELEQEEIVKPEDTEVKQGEQQKVSKQINKVISKDLPSPGKDQFSVMQLNVLMAEAQAAQRMAISNHNLYKEYLVRLHCQSPVKAPPQRPPKPTRDSIKPSTCKELNRIMHEHNELRQRSSTATAANTITENPFGNE